MSGGGSAAAPRAGSPAAHPGTRDPSDLEDLLAGQPLVTLEAAAHSMHGVEFYHGSRQATEIFDFQRALVSVRECRDWAQGPLAGDALEAKQALQDSEQLRGLGESAGVEGVAAIRIWTGRSPMCYVLTTVLRTAGHNLDLVKPYARLLVSALHALPSTFLYNEGPQGTLYRAMYGVLEGVEWSRDKQKVDNNEDVLYHFYAPTSFSMNQQAVRKFKPNPDDEQEFDSRTVLKLFGAVGYKVQALSEFPQEGEVLVEPVCSCRITQMKRFEGEKNEIPGEITNDLEGLDLIELRVKPGPSLLTVEGSLGPAKEAEERCYREWMARELDKLGVSPPEPLVKHPFSVEEWEQRGGERNDKDKSILGAGAFMTTYRMRNAKGECCAVKAVERGLMRHRGITKEDVEREAKILGSMRHTHVIRYHRLYDERGELGLVMEWAKGGSLGDRMKARAGQDQNISIPELLHIAIQLAGALKYIHGEGIVHRDIKIDNVLLANTEGEAVHIKLADFGVAARLATAAGNSSALYSKKGTDVYFSPERGEGATYGRKADMWAVGCIFVELARCKRLKKPLWSSHPEVADRRKTCLTDVEDRSPALARIVQGLLERDKQTRMAAARLEYEVVKVSLHDVQGAGAGSKKKKAKTATGAVNVGEAVRDEDRVEPMRKQRERRASEEGEAEQVELRLRLSKGGAETEEMVRVRVLSWDFGRDTACHGLRPAVTDANHDPREAGVKCVLYQ